MANIAFVTDDVNDNAALKVKSLIISLGHSCTAYREDSTPSLSSFDLIVASRINGGVGAHSQVVDAFDLGVPVILGLHRDIGSGIGPTANFLAGKLRLASEIKALESTSTYSCLTSDFNTDYTIGSTVKATSVNDLSNYLENDKLAPGAQLIFSYPILPTARSSVVLAARGSTNLSGTKFPASCAFVGFLYASSSDFTPAAKKLFGEVIDKTFALNVVYTHSISGYVLDENGTPLANTVCLYDQVTGELERVTTPDASGRYEFKVIKDKYFFVVCKSLSIDKNFKVYGFVQGVLV